LKSFSEILATWIKDEYQIIDKLSTAKYVGIKSFLEDTRQDNESIHIPNLTAA
jgi:hypothetical protein